VRSLRAFDVERDSARLVSLRDYVRGRNEHEFYRGKEMRAYVEGNARRSAFKCACGVALRQASRRSTDVRGRVPTRRIRLPQSGIGKRYRHRRRFQRTSTTRPIARGRHMAERRFHHGLSATRAAGGCARHATHSREGRTR
jgi:hypothetical protein